MQPMAICSWAIGSSHRRAFSTPTTSRYLGFYPFGFFSADYFPLIPWLFLFWTGFYLYHLVGKERLEPLHRSVCPPLGWLGRNSLMLYLLHQPVIYGVLTVVFLLLRRGGGAL